jgi:preprotein translocase subunit YajC
LNPIVILAQTTTAPAAGATSTTQPADVPPFAKFMRDANTFLPLILALVVFVWFMSRAKKKEAQKKQDLLKQLTRGTRVQTIGGIIATVVEAKDNEVVLKVDETTNTKMRFSRNAIHRVLGDEKADTK